MVSSRKLIDTKLCDDDYFINCLFIRLEYRYCEGSHRYIFILETMLINLGYCCIYYTGSIPEEYVFIVTRIYIKFNLFYRELPRIIIYTVSIYFTRSSSLLCVREPALRQLSVSSRIVVYIYNVLVFQFVLPNYLPNRKGATVHFGIKVKHL